MQNKLTNILLPVGRMVQGSLYKPSTTNAEGQPLLYKTGPKAGQQRVNYYIGFAIPKQGEQHWNQTAWGLIIWNEGNMLFPNQAQNPAFAWKVTDGDSVITDQNGNRPVDKEGFAGHWVLKLDNGLAPKIVNSDGSKTIQEDGFVNSGDFIQPYIYVVSNGSQQKPGLYLKPMVVAFQAYGDRISSMPDPKSLGFGKNTMLPAGASITPKSRLTEQQLQPVQAPPQQAAPYPQILQPPGTPVITPPLTPVHQMTPKAQGNSYEALIAAGWNDALLIQHGMMIV